MNLYEILGILLIHWFADFVLQTDKQAKGKSNNWTDLLSHTITYSICWFIIGLVLFFISPSTLMWAKIVWFFIITFIAHTITDYFTSRINSSLWRQQKIHYFFVSVGFDQLLHYIQLFGLYWLLIKTT